VLPRIHRHFGFPPRPLLPSWLDPCCSWYPEPLLPSWYPDGWTNADCFFPPLPLSSFLPALLLTQTPLYMRHAPSCMPRRRLLHCPRAYTAIDTREGNKNQYQINICAPAAQSPRTCASCLGTQSLGDAGAASLKLISDAEPAAGVLLTYANGDAFKGSSCTSSQTEIRLSCGLGFVRQRSIPPPRSLCMCVYACARVRVCAREGAGGAICMWGIRCRDRCAVKWFCVTVLSLCLHRSW